MYQLISKYDRQVKITNSLYLCQKWLYEHGSDWHMYEIKAV